MTPLAKPKIILLGGSNTVLKTGWRSHLAAQLGDQHEIVNLACGAASSLMGLYRFLHHADSFQPGDVVVWEYALNDHSYYRGGQPAAVLVDHVKWIVRLCHDRRMLFLPVILHPRPWYTQGQRKGYYAELGAFFDAAGLTPVNDEPLVRQRLAKGASLSRLYQDEAHFRTRNPILKTLTTQVAAAIEGLAPLGPKALQRSIWQPDAQLELLDDVECPERQPLSNRLFSGLTYPFAAAPKVSCQGTVLGLILTTDTRHRAIEIRSGGKVIGPFSTQANPVHVKKGWSLKQLSLDGQMPHRPLVADGVVSFQTVTPQRRPVVQSTFVWSDKLEVKDGPDIADALVGVLVQRGVDRPATTRLRFWLRAVGLRLARPIRSLRRKVRR